MSKETNLSSLDKVYPEITSRLSKLDLSERLLIISNLLFECYPLAKKADNIYNNLDIPEISPLESYATLKEFYNFHETSFVFVTLDRAHDLLAMQIELKKLMLNITKKEN